MIIVFLFLTFALLLTVFLSMNFTRTFLFKTAIGIVNEEFNGKISFQDIYFNPFKGLIVNNLLVTLNSDTIAFIPKARIDWDLQPFLKKKVLVKIVELESPRINLVKDFGDTLWNFQKFLKPKEKASKTSKTNIVIYLDNVIISNGKVRIRDKNHLTAENIFEPNNVDITSFDLKSNAKIDLSSGEFNINLDKLSLNENRSGFSLRKFSGTLHIDTNFIAAKYLSIETESSKIDAEILYNLQSSKLNFKLNDTKFNTNDLLKFVKLPIEKDINCDISGVGEIGENITFSKVSLNINNKTNLVLNGDVDIHSSPPNVTLRFSKLKAYENDVRNLLPEIFSEIPVSFGFFFSQNITLKYLNKGIVVNGSFITRGGTFVSNIQIDSNLFMNYRIKFQDFDIRMINRNLPVTALWGSSDGNIDLRHIERTSGYVSLDIPMGKVAIKGFDDFSLALLSKFNNGRFEVEKLKFVQNDTLGNAVSEVLINGNIDISNFKNLVYSGDIALKSFRLNSFFEQSTYTPENLTGEFHLEGKGVDLNSLALKLSGNVEEFMFSDRALFPFAVSLDIDHTDSTKRILVRSDILNGEIRGKYNITSLVDDLSWQFSAIGNAFEKKFTSVFKIKSEENFDSSFKAKSISKKQSSKKFHASDLEAYFDVNDFSLLGIFLNTNMSFSGTAKMKFTSNDTTSKLLIDTFAVKYFSFGEKKTKVSLSDLSLNAQCLVNSFENEPKLDLVKLNIATDNRIILGEEFLDYVDIKFQYSNDSLSAGINTGFNSIIATSFLGKATFSDTSINFVFDNLKLTYSNVFQWDLKTPCLVSVNSNSISVEGLNLERENAEQISLNGIYYTNDSINISGKVIGVPLNDFQKLLPEENSLSRIETFSGKVDEIDFKISNYLSSPAIVLGLNASGLKIENIEIGDLQTNASYADYNLTGALKLSSKKLSPLQVKLIEVPLKIDLKDFAFDVLKNREFKAQVECDNFELAVLQPFVSSSIENLNGSVKISAFLSGYLPEDLKFYGNINILEANFVPVANNIRYFVQGDITANGTEFNFEDIKVWNAREDYKNGSGTISGKIIFAQNRLERIDCYLFSNGIKVLSNTSVKSMPQLYGDLIISTSPNYLRFLFDRRELLLEGNVNILGGRLFMPSASGSQSVQESFVRYEISGSQPPVLIDTAGNVKEEQRQPSNLKIDLTLKFFQPIELTLDLTSIGQIYAIISLSDNSSSLRYYSDPKNNITLLTGNDLVLREGSTLKFVKLFKTEGKINFPTGSVDNPGLDLKATYEGQSIYNDAVRNFVVNIYITGTREKPVLRFDYLIDGQPAADDSSKVAQDAIFLLAFGKTKSEIEKTGVSGNFNLAEVSTSGGSALLSKFVSDALSGTGFISSADILLPPSSSSLDRTTLKMSGRFLGMTWNFGGTMADLLNNNELSIEVPIGTVLPFNFPNIILQLSRTSSLTQSIQRNQKDWEIKLKYGSTW